AVHLGHLDVQQDKIWQRIDATIGVFADAAQVRPGYPAPIGQFQSERYSRHHTGFTEQEEIVGTIVNIQDRFHLDLLDLQQLTQAASGVRGDRESGYEAEKSRTGTRNHPWGTFPKVSAIMCLVPQGAVKKRTRGVRPSPMRMALSEGPAPPVFTSASRPRRTILVT